MSLFTTYPVDIERSYLQPAFGGQGAYTFSPEDNPILRYYQAHSIGAPEHFMPTRNASFASTAEVFYTADNTPMPSRRASQSIAGGDTLRMTKSFHVLPTSGMNARFENDEVEQSTPSTDDDDRSASNKDSAVSTSEVLAVPEQGSSFPAADGDHDEADGGGETLTSLERIRSLADFKLYLSPSRRAQVDLLASDSEDEGEDKRDSRRRTSSQRTAPPTLQRRRTLRPALFDGKSLPISIANRRSRPPLRLLGIPAHMADAEETRRSYSDLLIRHHAAGLQRLDGIPPELLRRQQEAEAALNQSLVSSRPSDNAEALAPSLLKESAPQNPETAQEISAFSRSSNPYYGYPAIRLTDPLHPAAPSIRPRYARRRKRDLVRTLLFLFLLRLQSWRDAFERALGLNRLLPWTGGVSASRPYVKASDPSEGLLRTVQRDTTVKRTTGSDWLWAVVGLALLRGGWVRILAWPLELLGLHGLRQALGV